ncbi:hypothetical protein [Sodalis sp. (in: enterobacteria)]|uniref:hypothetical protein n=1 Tax=Sodalis sp. (in: enterobacteria) TaxID=1898979 RepID=UPI003F685442
MTLTGCLPTIRDDWITPWPIHERTGLAYHLDDPPAVVAQDIVTTRAKDHD